MEVLDNKRTPASSRADYEKGIVYLKLCFEKSSIDQNSIKKYSKALYCSPLVGTTRNYYEQQATSSDSYFESSVAARKRMPQIIDVLSSRNGTQTVYSVKILFGHKNDVWAIGYQVLQTNVSNLYIFRYGKEDQIFVLQLAGSDRECFFVHAMFNLGTVRSSPKEKTSVQSELQSS